MLVTTVAPSNAPSHDRTSHDRTSHPRTVEVVSDYERFVRLEPQWNALAERAGVPHPFLRHEWVRSWWDAFGGTGALHIVLVKAGDEIVAIAPLMRETARMYGVPVSRLRFLQNDHTPRTDVIVPAASEAAYRALWDALRQDDSWDVLQLNQLVTPSVTSEMFSRFAATDGMSSGTWDSGDSPYLALTGTWDQYFGSLSAKFRSNIRNRMTRLTRLGEPALEVLRDPAAIAAAYADALRLEASGWKAEQGTSICSDPAVQRFYTQLTQRAAARGWLELLFLTAGGRRIATSYGSTYDGRLFLFKTGYDPECATCSPFKLLTYFAIRHAYERGLREVDFLGDAEPWKLEWTSTTRSHDWLFVFSATRRARLLHSIKFQWGPELKRWRA